MIIQDDEPLPISPRNLTSGKPASAMNDKEEVTSYPSPLLPPKLPTSSHPQTSNGNSCSTQPYSSSSPMANYPSFITLTTPQQGQQDFTPNSDSTSITTPVNRLSSRQLHFQADKTESTLELPSEINNAICLSYNCNQWHAEPDDDAELEVSVPKCRQCEELKEENRRLKTTIEKLQSEEANFTSKYIHLFQLRLSPSEAEKTNTSTKDLLGIANKLMNFLAIPSKLSCSYSTFPLCSGTTLIEITVYNASNAIWTTDILGRQIEFLNNYL